eukprot:7381560-Prymnesium_polylepis.2
MTRAVSSASRLCFRTYAAHSGGNGATPSGEARDRSFTGWRTLYELHGGAKKTASNQPLATASTIQPPPSSRSTSCRQPPSLVSRAMTSCPRARSSRGS